MSQYMPRTKKASLVLEDGTVFAGEQFGAPRPVAGEVVFTTGMTGYPQFLTDPSFRGQIIVSTYPLMGNYGVPVRRTDRFGLPDGFESGGIQARALVVSDLCGQPSHYASSQSLGSWFEEENVPGIADIDTRALTKHLRAHGVMKGKILVDGCPDVAFGQGEESNPAAAASCDSAILYRGGEKGFSATEWKPRQGPGSADSGMDSRADSWEARTAWSGASARPRILLVDCGVKANIIRSLLVRGADVLRVPWNRELVDIACDGIVVGNGPGDPKSCGKTIASLRKVLEGKTPVFGICLGNQLLALAAGADTYKLPYGHRSQNQPCREAKTERCYITSQNHGYAVREDSLPQGWEPWFVNANDGTIEGIRSADGRHSAVQFHPEGCPGPRDTEFLLDRFLAMAKGDRT
ncbi:MAG: glutamine-hydrolyzing carbamoyl-phosphate synthase small subunit [Rectinemataceae bacterium]